ncbi:hypothetical protein ABIB50_000601 [Mucilaginibacter sp. UYCu711]
MIKSNKLMLNNCVNYITYSFSIKNYLKNA